jgi:hypothetical protein
VESVVNDGRGTFSARARDQAFVLSGYVGAPTVGSATIQQFGRAERWRRALWDLAKWWGVAILVLFIPVAHFVLVPAFLLYGLHQFYVRATTAELVTAARGRCPDCGEDQTLDLAARWHAPQAVTCRACHRGLVLARAPQSFPL